MARTGTPYLDLGQYDEEDNPGSGEKNVAGPGLNGDRTKIDTAVGAGHNADGSHKANTIDGPQLKTTAMDQVTLEMAGSPLKGQIKDGGVSTAKLADDAVTAAKLNADTAGNGITQDAGGAHQVNVDNTTLEIASDVVRQKDGGTSTAKLADDAVTAAKQAHNNNRTKCLLPFYVAATDEYARTAGVIMTTNLGIVVGRAGSVTGLTINDATGATYTTKVAYGSDPFAATERITIKHYTSGTHLLVIIAGVSSDFDIAVALNFPITGILEVELDD